MKLWRNEMTGKSEINTLQSFGLFLHQKVLLCGKLGDNSWLSVSPVFQPGQTFATTPFCGKLSGQHSTSSSQHVSIEKWILSQNICYRSTFVSNCVFCKKYLNCLCPCFSCCFCFSGHCTLGLLLENVTFYIFKNITFVPLKTQYFCLCNISICF